METKTVIAATTGHAHLVGSLKPKRFAIFSIMSAPKKRALVLKTFCKQRRVHLELKCEGFLPDNTTLSAMMRCYAYSGLLPQSQAIWEEMLYSSSVPSVQVVSELIDNYARSGIFDEVIKILDQLSSSRTFDFFHQVYSLAISCFGKGGQLDLMEDTLKKMVSKGLL
ncbi:hypothetical protein Peur_044522 [Populus x canadensis]|uniref:Pentatricopeptide repeat-containing protein n=1 Tax=Populus deltoides TaxID=3696 RepID=A0A8T2YMA2_POPDE|nr:hypothetical protein H0E87_013163 [Populus deltoides]